MVRLLVFQLLRGLISVSFEQNPNNQFVDVRLLVSQFLIPLISVNGLDTAELPLNTLFSEVFVLTTFASLYHLIVVPSAHAYIGYLESLVDIVFVITLLNGGASDSTKAVSELASTKLFNAVFRSLASNRVLSPSAFHHAYSFKSSVTGVLKSYSVAYSALLLSAVYQPLNRYPSFVGSVGTTAHSPSNTV